VRAFLLPTNGTPRELLAQLDPLSHPGQARLTLILPGPLPKGTEAAIHLYLGLPQPPLPLPGAVHTNPGPNGMQWLENDRVRLLLRAEGAHVYRWELKAETNRDLTMPGDTDWAGFGDIVSHRNTPYRLECTSHGPAMVEFQCTDPAAQTKTIHLYGGVSWMEVLLSEPTSIFWNFDNPKNFAADGPTPGTWRFSNGQTGPVGREAEGVPAQVKARDTFWGIKYNTTQLALGLVTPEIAVQHVIAPGAGAGGVGIESSRPAKHFVTFAGKLETSPEETMNRLQSTLNLNHPVEVQLHAIQTRP
jgi:hypothetical protein